MKNNMSEISGNVFKFFVWLVIILAIARFSGFLTGFGAKDFQVAYNKLLLSLGNVGSIGGSRYNGYTVQNISDGVMMAAEREYFFRSGINKKMIFYGYDSDSIDFHNNLNRYISLREIGDLYYVMAYPYSDFKYLNYGALGASKVCNSLKECEQYRQNAVNHSEFTTLLKKCGKTVCIFNFQRKQYIILRKKDYNELVNALFMLKNW